jgi:nucleoid-associated protein YgaU
MSRRTLPAPILAPARSRRRPFARRRDRRSGRHRGRGRAEFSDHPEQRATAKRAAEAGVPLSEIKPDAPDIYTVKNRDTLWGISSLYLKSPGAGPSSGA